MLKIISPKILSSALALALFANIASAAVVGDTTSFVPHTAEAIDPGTWAAGYFLVKRSDCPNGCDITEASLLLDGTAYDALAPVSIEGMKLEIFSNASSPFNPTVGDSIFEFISPSDALFNGNFGTSINFAASAQASDTPALLQPDTGYWLYLTNVDQSPGLGWFFNGVDKSGQFWASSQFGSGSGTPFIFTVSGDARLSAVPLPGAVWMMGSGLIGLMAAGRRRIR